MPNFRSQDQQLGHGFAALSRTAANPDELMQPHGWGMDCSLKVHIRHIFSLSFILFLTDNS